MAITPIAPTWLSFMISSVRSRERELRKPSAVSDRPSRCRQPEKRPAAGPAPPRPSAAGPPATGPRPPPPPRRPTQARPRGRRARCRPGSASPRPSRRGSAGSVRNRSGGQQRFHAVGLGNMGLVERGHLGEDPLGRVDQVHRQGGAGPFAQPQVEVQQRLLAQQCGAWPGAPARRCDGRRSRSRPPPGKATGRSARRPWR